MAQNAYLYSVIDWSNDINMAERTGIDGFSLSIAQNDYKVPRIADAYTASADATSANTFKCNNNVLGSTYLGESYGDAFWAGFKSALVAQGITVTLAPAFRSFRDLTLARSLLSTFPSINGFFNWWSWPADTNRNLTTATDLAYQSAINNWAELSDTLWDYRWEQTASQVVPDIVEIVICRNDYSKSHYIGDINPNVDRGTLAPNYNGVSPAGTDDQVISWYRAHPKGITCNAGTFPRNAAFPVDAVFAMVILSDGATMTLDIDSDHY
ncbi:hypothetical protein FRB97_005837 [Tulasnella sp. 331]|nr:hypothetical protein FRB97_005837 [Tulasnella sp. 331]